MRTALDSNILSAIWSQEASAALIAEKLDEAQSNGVLVLSPVAYSELHAQPRISAHSLRRKLEDHDIQIDFALTESVWTEAGVRYAQYAERKRKAMGASEKRLLADFLVGAHALLQADSLMTTDIRRYRTYFPELILYAMGT